MSWRLTVKLPKLSEHKQNVKLLANQWRVINRGGGSGQRVRLWRTRASLFSTHWKTQTMMVFGKPLRSAEILHIGAQHHGIEQFWRHLKTDLRLSAMSLHQRNGAYGTLGIKIFSYLMIQQVRHSTRLTFHQIKLQLSAERQMLSIISAHFHEQNTQEHS